MSEPPSPESRPEYVQVDKDWPILLNQESRRRIQELVDQDSPSLLGSGEIGPGSFKIIKAEADPSDETRLLLDVETYYIQVKTGFNPEANPGTKPDMITKKHTISLESGWKYIKSQLN